MQNHDFGVISCTANLAHEINFQRVFDLKIPWGPCAARNVQNFGIVTRDACSVVIVMNFVVHELKFIAEHRLCLFQTWLVETVLKSGLESNIALWWLAACWSRFGRIFLVRKFHVFGLCSKFCQSFGFSSCPVPAGIM